MKKWLLLLAAFCFTAGTAFADVTHEIFVGLEGDSTVEAMDSFGADVTDQIDNANSLFIFQYTRFFSPLMDDDKPIELRQFYQHPSTLSAGLAFFGATDKNSSIPSDTETSGSMLLLGGEYFFPTNTGVFLNLGAGSGKAKDNTGGTDEDLEISRFELGVHQYVGQNVAFHLRLDSESYESTPSGFPSTTNDKSVTFLGVRGIVRDIVGLSFEIGGGERELDSGGSTTKFDVAAVNLEIAGYIGKQLSVRLGLEAEVEDMQGMPAGIEHTTTTGRSTLAARYWFSERFGMELPLYSETIENKTVFPGGEFKDRTTNSGMGLYAAFRF